MLKENISFFIALRYLRSRKSGFLSFVSNLAFISTSLGVAVLIIVSSVMNGFEKELRERILNVIPHGSIYGVEPIENWESLQDSLSKDKNLQGFSPFIKTESLLISGNDLSGTIVYGVFPDFEANVSVVDDFMIYGSLNSLEENGNIVLGNLLAMKLNINLGDRVSIILPDKNSSIAGYFPRTKSLKVSGIFKVGSREIDEAIAYISIRDAMTLNRLDNKIHGYRLKYKDLFSAPMLIWETLALTEKNTAQFLNIEDWSFTYGPLFEAIMMEKSLVLLLLFLVIIVASFNIIAMLIMLINEKKEQIAILKTIGMSKKDIYKIFLYLGTMIAIIGIAIGLLVGILLTLFIGSSLFEIYFSNLMEYFGTYFISYFPYDLRFEWVLGIIFSALLLTVISGIYPAKVASKLHPVEILRNE